MERLFVLLLLAFPALASAQDLHTFSNGEVADAEKINENFQYVMENASTEPPAETRRRVLGLTSVAVPSVGILNKTRQCIVDFGATAAICRENEVISSPALVGVADTVSDLSEILPDGTEAPLKAVWILPTVVSVENFNRTYLTVSSAKHFSNAYEAGAAGICLNQASYDDEGLALDMDNGTGIWISCRRSIPVLCCGSD